MIDKAHLLGQVEHLENEKKQLIVRLHNIDGAIALARNLEYHCERQEAEAKAAEVAEQHNGQHAES